jgi:hypothetical protein
VLAMIFLVPRAACFTVTQVSMVYPPENVAKSDNYHFEIRLLKLRFFTWFIVPIYRYALVPLRRALSLRWDSSCVCNSSLIVASCIT